MKRLNREYTAIIGVFTLITAVFFYKFVIGGLVPFPGDILASDFQPWRSSSYLGYNAGAIPHKAQYPDVVRQMYPWKTLAVSELKNGRLPLWNPHNFSGAPLLANFQSAVLYPPGILYFLLPQITAWSVLVFLQPLLAAIGTYWYCRMIGLGKYGAMLSAVTYGFSGFMSVWLEYNTVGHVIAWLPWMLLCVEHLHRQISAPWLGLLAFTHFAAATAGHPQVYAYTVAFTLVYTLVHEGHRKTKTRIFLGHMLGMGMAAVQFIPGLELILHAARSPHEFSTLFTKILIQPWQTVMLIFPTFFGHPATRTYWPADTFVGKVITVGLVPLFFLPAVWRYKTPRMVFFMVSALAVFLGITANPITYILYRIPVPFISSSSPTLMSFLLAFSLAVLAGFGLDRWMEEPHTIQKLMKRTVQTIAGVVFLAALVYVPIATPAQGHEFTALRSIAYGSVFIATILALFWAAITNRRLMKAAVTMLLIVQAAELFMFFHKFNPFTDMALVYPDHPVLEYLKNEGGRFWGYGTAAIPANLATATGTYSPEGYDPLYPRWYGELLYAYLDGSIYGGFTDRTRSDAAVASSFGDGGLSDIRKQKILSVLGVSVILDRVENGSTAELFPAGNFILQDRIDDWKLFRNTLSVPRAYMVSRVDTYSSRDEFNEKFFSADFDPRSRVLLHTVPAGLTNNHADGSTEILSYQPTSVSIQTHSNAPAVLVLTDTYYPGWRGTIDGKYAEILKANWALRAIVVPTGNHIVSMKYEPDSFRIGLGISFISVISTIALLLVTRRSNHVTFLKK